MFGVFAIDEILRYRGSRIPGSRTLCHPARPSVAIVATNSKSGCKLKSPVNITLYYVIIITFNSDWDGDVSLCRPSNSWQVRDQYVKRSHSLLSPFCHSCHQFIIVFTSLSFLSPFCHSCHQFIIVFTSLSLLSPFCHSCH